MERGAREVNPLAQSSVRPRELSITLSHEAREYLSAQPIEQTLLQGARNALLSYLGLQPGERVVLIAETGNDLVARALLHEADEAGAETTVYVVNESHAKNDSFITRLTSKLESTDVSLLLGSAKSIPEDFQQRIIHARGGFRRHAQLLGVTPAIMTQSMRADCEDIHSLGEKVRARLDVARSVEIVCSNGVRLTVPDASSLSWRNESGRRLTTGCTSLPPGEVHTQVNEVDGELIPDGSIFQSDGTLVGRFSPITFQFERGRFVHAVRNARDSVGSAFVDALEQRHSPLQIRQIGLGLNTTVLTPVGVLAQDRKMVGAYVIIGRSVRHPGEETGGDQDLVLMLRRVDILADGVPLMVRGRYVREVLS